MHPDLSLVLNLHDETRYLARTLRSSVEAVQYAGASGITTELVMVLDRPSADTERWVAKYQASCFTSVRSIIVDNGSLGPSRADGVAAAEGTYVTLADGDDLISFNMLTGMMDTARSAGPDAIVIPEYLLEFGERHHVTLYCGDPVVGALQTLFSHPFMSRLLMRRDRFNEIAVLDIPLGTGYAFEDWHFNSEAFARGMRIVTARDTVLYYRKRRTSLSAGSKTISTGQIPPTRLADPEVVLHLLAEDYAEWTRGAAAERHGMVLKQADAKIRNFLLSPLCRELTFAANRIDPAIELWRYGDAPTWTNLREPVRPGLAYYRLCKLIEARRYTDVFLLPFMARGGAEKYLLNVMHGLTEIYSDIAILVLTGERVASHAWLELLPEGSTFIDLRQMAPDCSDDEIDRLTLKVIQAVAPDARIHLKHCAYTFRFWDRFGRVLATANRGIFYRFLDVAYQDGGREFVGGHEFDFISNNLDTLALLVTDNQRIISQDHQRFNHFHKLWRWLPTECTPAHTVEQVRTRPAEWQARLLWASRLDTQKRPHLLPALADAMRRRNIHASIDVFGEPLLQDFDIANLQCDGLNYRGSFNAFEDLAHDTYDAFIYTAEFDGLPNVVLEALGAGLPVIAPEIGGVAEVVRHGATGWLVPPYGSSDVLANAFCDAIEELYSDLKRHRRMAVAAVELIQARHGRRAFLRHLSDVFGD